MVSIGFPSSLFSLQITEAGIRGLDAKTINASQRETIKHRNQKRKKEWATDR